MKKIGKLIMENDLSGIVEKILQKEELAEKKLIRKIYLIISGMILLLTTIIIVEFKEYSHNYTEYKIGLSELGPKDLVWAGIMGTPPRYYESDEKHGLGYREFDTREMRKALEEAGINLIYRYMSPNRLEFEFERKHPICFYDKQWSNPKEYFKKKRHAILSIPRDYSGKGSKKIFFRKGEKFKFEKHLDAKGNLRLNSLIQDSSLKTELIRKVEYDGPFANITYGIRQPDGTYYDYIKPQFQKHIDLVILHTNDQIIQMLRWKRFDYQFFDTLEYDDYPWMDGGKKGIETLVYDIKTITDVDDPNLIFHSVACGNHPLTKYAMPIINEVIKTIRSNEANYTRAQRNERKQNPLSERPPFKGFLAGGSWFAKTIDKMDEWYFIQFAKWKIKPWPMFNQKKQFSPLNIQKNMENLVRTSTKPLWNLIEKTTIQGEKSVLIINDVDIKANAEEEILKDKFFENNLMFEKRIVLDKKINFTDLSFSKIKLLEKIIIFAREIKDQEFEIINSLIKSPSLKNITLIESSPYQTKQILKFLPKDLERLRFYDVPLVDLPFAQTIARLKHLKELNLQADKTTLMPLRIENKELISTILNLPNTLEVFSLVGTTGSFNTDFPFLAAENFAKKNFSNIKEFTLLNFFIDDKVTKLILDSLPLTIESLIFGSDSTAGGISSLLLADFLNRRKDINKLKRLRLHQMYLSLHPENTIYLPMSLKDLWLTDIVGLNEGNFHRIIFTPKIKLKNLVINYCNLSDYSIPKLLNYLDNHVENIDLGNNKIVGSSFSLLSNTLEIEKLSLESNPINDVGIFYLSKLPWKIKKLDISNVKITDSSSIPLTSNKLWELTSLKIGDNHLSSRTINKILARYGKGLKDININNILSLDIKFFSKHLSKSLESLSLAGNMLNNEDLALLAKTLPKDLSYLDISGIRMSANGAYSLAKKMPNLNTFYFDFKFGEEEEGLQYILKTLSPYLRTFSTKFTDPLSWKNAKLLSDNMPKYLYNFNIPEFDKEECKILLGSLPHSIRHLHLSENIKTLGNSTNELIKIFPSQLLSMWLGDNLSQKERDNFFTNLPHRNIVVYPAEYINTYSWKFVSISSNFILHTNGTLKNEYFNGISLPATTSFLSKRNEHVPKGFFYSLKEFQLKNIRYLQIPNCKNIETKELIDLLKKLPSDLLVLRLNNTNLKLEDVDNFIAHLPKNLKVLSMSLNSFGEEGIKKFRDFKKKMEDKTGLPFYLVE